MQLPADLLQKLNQSGWTPDRQIQIDDPNIFAAARNFLSNWGDLSVRRTNVKYVDWFDFKWLDAMDNYYPDIVSDFSKLLGRPLFVVGECDCGSTTILIDDLGRFFRDCDTVLHLAALSPEQLVYNLWNSPDYDRTGLTSVLPLDRKTLL